MARILLVEDEKMIREPFVILLEAQGYEIDVAANGQEALEFCQQAEYEVVLLDLMMPVLDGVGFLKAADLSRRAPKTRVVVLSNLSSGEMLTEALALGAHRHEVKSNLSPREVLAVVAEELE